MDGLFGCVLIQNISLPPFDGSSSVSDNTNETWDGSLNAFSPTVKQSHSM